MTFEERLDHCIAQKNTLGYHEEAAKVALDLLLQDWDGKTFYSGGMITADAISVDTTEFGLYIS